MPDERFVFPAAVEGMLLGLGELATPAFKAHLKKHGLDVANVPPAIPMAQFSPVTQAAATYLWPDVPEEEALRLLGLQFIRGWRNTMLGSASSMVLRVLGPSRTLTRLDRAIRTSDNFTRSVTELVSANEALVTINEVQGMPSYWVGVLQGGLEVLGRQGSVTMHAVTLPSATYRVTWI